MVKVTRRKLIKTGTVAAAAAMVSPALLNSAKAWAASSPWQPEPGASLRLMRWSKWIDTEDIAFNKNVAAFEAATGVRMRVDSEWLDDVQPKAAVAANIGSGPDIVWGMLGFAHLFPEKLVDVSDLAMYLGTKHGGWYPIAEKYGKWGNQWITIPWSTGGNYINYRKSMCGDVGYDKFPATTDAYLDLARKLKKKGTPIGHALGHATGDGNLGWQTMMWAFGSHMVNEEGTRVTINSKETIAALKWAKELSSNFIKGCPSWGDGHNNKAFLDEQVSVTNNGISIYVKALTEGQKGNSRLAKIAKDMDHSSWPIGPIGKPVELQFSQPMCIFKHTKYPNAAKAFIAFMIDKKQYNHWLGESKGYFTHTLHDYDNHPVWDSDPKIGPFEFTSKNSEAIGYPGPLGYAAAAVLADFVLIDMIASVCTGGETPQDAAKIAEKRANRYYRV